MTREEKSQLLLDVTDAFDELANALMWRQAAERRLADARLDVERVTERLEAAIEAKP